MSAERGSDPSAPAATPSAVPATGSDLARVWIVAITAVIAIAGAALGSGAFGGTPVQDAAGGALDADATLIAPAAPAFTIWSLIYFGLAAYAVWQALPAQRASARQRRVGYLVAASLLLNAAWLLVVQAGLLWLSVIVIALLLAVLCTAYAACVRHPPHRLADALLTDGVIGLYLGWVSVATAANVTAALVDAGFDGWGIPPAAWAIAVLALVTLVMIALAAFSRGGLAPMLSAVWGLVWIAVGRLTGEPASFAVGLAAIVAAVVVVVATLAIRFVTGRQERLGPVPDDGPDAPRHASESA
ncbi:TspO/MBR family protein [Agromyces larvae]|uniref:Tryptophan-rich sensory protein n=1 Tax=Agromyces larvae TaxID=2929802 RepID=A0ABY4BUQ9_9MICO|nr:TspO/MBR family protein [Agromyces larvae]UOE42937.1 tryptophan-rich sensory protein [Agromyces larvae]